jgi:hypothetical protein
MGRVGFVATCARRRYHSAARLGALGATPKNARSTVYGAGSPIECDCTLPIEIICTRRCRSWSKGRHDELSIVAKGGKTRSFFRDFGARDPRLAVNTPISRRYERRNPDPGIGLREPKKA